MSAVSTWPRLRTWANQLARPPGRLSALDAVFLPMETDLQPLHVGSLLLLEGPEPRPEEVHAHLAERVAQVPVARRRLVGTPWGLGRPRWAEAPTLDLLSHLHSATADPPGDRAALASLVLRLMAPRLDLSRPPWELWTVSGLADGRWAVVVKAHHALVDGVYGSDLALTVLADAPLPPAAGRHLPAPSAARFAAEGVVWLVLLPLRAVGGLVRTALHPCRAVLGLRRVRHGIAQVVRPDLPSSPLSGPLSGGRRWGWTSSDLVDVRDAAHAAGTTVNDVFLSVLAGGFRRYLLASGLDPAAVVLRAIVPVSQRDRRDPGQPGNLASAVFVVLPAALDDAGARLGEVGRRTGGQKAGGVGASTASVVALADHIPWPLMAAAFRAYARHGQRRVNVIASNVPGPEEPQTILGRRLIDVVPYVPLGEEVRTAAGLVSCGGRVSLAVTVDAALPDAEGLIDAVIDQWRTQVDGGPAA